MNSFLINTAINTIFLKKWVWDQIWKKWLFFNSDLCRNKERCGPSWPGEWMRWPPEAPSNFTSFCETFKPQIAQFAKEIVMFLLLSSAVWKHHSFFHCDCFFLFWMRWRQNLSFCVPEARLIMRCIRRRNVPGFLLEVLAEHIQGQIMTFSHLCPWTCNYLCCSIQRALTGAFK